VADAGEQWPDTGPQQTIADPARDGPRPGLTVLAVVAMLTSLVMLAGAAVIVKNYAFRGSPSLPSSFSHGSNTRYAGAEPTLAGEGPSAFAQLAGGSPLIAASHGAPNKSATGGSPAGIANSVLFGGDMPLAMREGRLGRKLGIVRAYYRLGDRFPRTMDARLMTGGTTELVSLDTVPGGPTYASIASGQHDSVIVSFLRAMERAAVAHRLGAIYVTFEHEADNPYKHAGLGTPAQFVQAWDHVHRLATSAHLNWNQGGRLHWVLILRHVAYARGGGLANAYWPGTSEVDVVATDGYQTNGCRGSLGGQGPGTITPGSLFDPLLGFASSHGGLPVFIAEWGSVAYPSPAVRPAYIRAMEAYVAANHQIAAAMYWDGRDGTCNFSVDNSPASFAALAAMGQSPIMQASVAR
jgi:hypothetical protein